MDEEKSFDFVEIEELEGFRDPSEEERIEIAAHYERLMKRKKHMMLLLGICVIIMTANLWGYRIYFFASFLCLLLIQRLFQRWKNNKDLLHKLANGIFKVMDCRISEKSFNNMLGGGAKVKIYNVCGQYCKSIFRVDRGIAKSFQASKDITLQLIQCNYSFYELYLKQSERR